MTRRPRADARAGAHRVRPLGCGACGSCLVKETIHDPEGSIHIDGGSACVFRAGRGSAGRAEKQGTQRVRVATRRPDSSSDTPGDGETEAAADFGLASVRFLNGRALGRQHRGRVLHGR